MNIEDYFRPKTKKQPRKRKANNARRYFITKTKEFVNKGIIDLLDYSRIVEYYKIGGSIVYCHKFIEIITKIYNSKLIPQEEKEKYRELIHKTFGHILNLMEQPEKIIKDVGEYDNSIEFTNDQKNGIINITKFLYDPNESTYGLYGYAGTGKTTTITRLLHYLLCKKYIKSVVFAAPTNKAVNILKSKFRSGIERLLGIDETIENMNDILEQLDKKGIKIHFLTIHKLLNYKNDYNMSGERIFTKGKKSSISSYDVTIVDECSMVQFLIMNHIFEDNRKFERTTDKKKQKIIFIGDPAQLPPVNEKKSLIFSKSEEDFDYKKFRKSLNTTIYTDYKREFEQLKKDILKQRYVVLQEIVRSNDNDVIGLCNNVRSWVINSKNRPTLGKFRGKMVKIYKRNKKLKDKTRTKWYQTFIKKCQEKTEDNWSNIILTWTNNQCKIYNNRAREIIFKKSKLNKYEIGDILVLTDFYNMEETKYVNNKEVKNNKQFYTSEQIKITDLEKIVKAVSPFSEMIQNSKLRNSRALSIKYSQLIRNINKNTKRQYNVWKIYVHKLIDASIKDKIPDTYQIYVVRERDSKILANDREYASKKITEFIRYIRNYHNERKDYLIRELIKPFWREWNKRFIEPFAKVNYSYSLSIHKSQGSSYFNVFVDLDDVMKNKNIDETKRCIYTALTRTSNELHILV